MRYVYFIVLSVFLQNVYAQLQPGDVFRDYVWTTGDFHQKFLRVINDGDYRDPVHFSICYPEDQFEDGWLLFDHDIDLKNAVKAEVQIEKLQSHDGTKGFAVKINESPWLLFPEGDSIPYPQWDYLYHTYPVIEVPLKFVQSGKGNKLRFRVNQGQRFGMPQNILYGIHLRIYYAASENTVSAAIGGIKNKSLAKSQKLFLENPNGKIKQVSYVACYTDVNYEGDGIYHQWHYTFYRGALQHHIGSSSEAPFAVEWNTEWIPDQNKPLTVAAIIEDESGLCYFTEPVSGLTLNRDYEVWLCRPFNQPKMWATREGEFTHMFNLPRNPQEAEAFQLVWTSWSPGYMNGLYLNDWVVFTHEGQNYAPGFHIITSSKTHMLNWGLNTVKTGKTPKVFGDMVHGMEMLYPGVMALIKFPAGKK